MAMIRSMPVLQVKDLLASLVFYERLGFVSHGTWGEPPVFVIVQRGDVTFALDQSREDVTMPVNQWWSAYVYVDDVEALHREFSSRTPDVVTALYDQEYGCRDFDVIDPDGHRLAFGQVLATAERPGLSDDRGRG